LVTGVTGYSAGSGGNLDYYTAKYAAATGVLLWEQRYNDPEDDVDYAQAVAVDSSGNVVVTGSSTRSSGSNADYYTAKYAAADGAPLWEQRYNGPANSHDTPEAVAVDSSDNVVVAGSSVGSSRGDYDYYTAKYAAVDGALLWEQRYKGQAKGNDFVGGIDFWSGSRGLALGPNGMVVITGFSGGDYATVVYREILPPISIALVPTGVRLSFTGTRGLSYKIERAPAVTGPWTTINTQTAPASGLLEYLAAPPLPDQAFYRTVQP
jgi:outer membrane protein assembly factor BamB